jgi:hypothetical protein
LGKGYNWAMMKTVIRPINSEELSELAQEIGGFYVKVVADLKKGILAAGAKMHVDEEQELINGGSDKNNLWGGGYDLEAKQITYDSIINNKPGVNASSDILEPEIRKKFDGIVKKLLNI